MFTWWRFRRVALAAMGCALCLSTIGTMSASAQELGGAGTVQGTVKDPTGGVMVAVGVTIRNPVSGFMRDTTTDQAGKFVFRNLAPNPYHIEASAQGFRTLEQDVLVRTSVPITLDLTLTLAGAVETVAVVGHAEELLERDPTTHTDIDQSLVEKLPLEAGPSGLNQVVMLASPGVVADANGFFHPIGDHAQTQFSIDNQPVTDQQSRIYSNQISPNAVQSLEVITGVPPAEFGDKDSLVVRVVTKSGLGLVGPMGSFTAGYGSFKSPTAEITLGVGNDRFGNFLSATGLWTDRFLDPPEFDVLHGAGSSRSLFNRMDFRVNDTDTVHLNVNWAQSAFDVPNTIDQDAAGQAQRQRIATVNVAPGYSRVLNASTLLAANAYVRQDRVVYTPSADPFADSPGTAGQTRRLTNVGAKVDLSWVSGMHNVKVGGAISGTTLTENFTFGVTDPTLNSPCTDPAANDEPSADTTLTDDTQCAGAGLDPNPEWIAGLTAHDLSRGGTLFTFNQGATIKQQAFYVQDEMRAGNATLKVGLRADHYDGLVTKTLAQPRVGLSYAVPRTGTIVRASYGRTLETPYNENLILSNRADPAVFGTSGLPLEPGTRDQMDVGVQQAFGGWVVVDFGYFYKYTTNAYDFGVLFDTPIFFPVSWDHSKIDGVTGRVSLVEHGGFSAFTVFGHTNAIFTPPGTGGLLFEAPPADFRIDHDQKFQQTTNLQYVFVKPLGGWVAFSWRYDSGLVAGAVPDYATALTLSGDQQAAIGLFCGSMVATPAAPITSCSSPDRGAKRYHIPADGAADDVTNPPRIAPRSLFDLGFGADNLLRTNRAKLRVRVSVVNLANNEALYNFLSTFSGTHFVTPRAVQFQAGVTF